MLNINLNLNNENVYVETINIPTCENEILTIVHTIDKSGFNAIIFGGIEIIYDTGTNTIYADTVFEGTTFDAFEEWLSQFYEECITASESDNIPLMRNLLTITIRSLRAAYNECQS